MYQNKNGNILMQRYAQISAMRGIQNNKLVNTANQGRQIKDVTTTNEHRDIKEIILDQHHVDKKLDKSQFNRMFNNVNRTHDEIDKLWKQRTNQPYKNITSYENFKKDYKTQDDLILHRVNNTDKDLKVFVSDMNKMKQQLNLHNNELRDKYSDVKRDKYEQEFEYNHIKKYNVKYDPTSFENMKGDIVAYYKKEQLEQEKDKKNIDDVIESMIGLDDPKGKSDDSDDNEKDKHIYDPTEPNTQQKNCDIVSKYKKKQKKI